MISSNDKENLNKNTPADNEPKEGENISSLSSGYNNLMDSENQNPTETEDPDPKKRKEKKHLIKNKFLRVTLKTLGWIILMVMLLPIAIYIPPVQTLLKNIACSEVKKATGMDISIDRFRLKFPLDLALDGVLVKEASGDTMAVAKKAVVDVAALPLLKLDLKVNKLDLEEGYYRMVSPDSSMIMKIHAGKLSLDNRTNVNIAASEINVGTANLSDGSVELYMNVWKKQYTPSDSTSTPFIIKADRINLDRFSFAMSMLPTIDTLNIAASSLVVKKGVIDLRKNNVSLKYAALKDGNASYITPTPEYIASHPAPPPGPPSPPMTITGDSLSIDGFNAIYAVKGAKEGVGFNPSFIKADGIGLGIKDFYNQASTVKLPLSRLTVKNLAGLNIVEGKATVGVDSIGLDLKGVDLRTPFTHLTADADIPFAVMALDKNVDMFCKAKGSLGMPDVDLFMPAAKPFTAKIPGRRPLDFAIDASGSLSDITIDRLDVAIDRVISLNAEGKAANLLDFKKLKADIDFEGALSDPSLVAAFTNLDGINIPSLKISGYAIADADEYEADFKLLTSAGDLAASGIVAMNSEHYNADIDIHNFHVDRIMPSLGIGEVSASLQADGAGFNPTLPNARTSVAVNLKSLVYNKSLFTGIRADATLSDGHYDITATSINKSLDFDIAGTGTIAPDLYTFDITADLRHVDLEAMGFTPTMNNGNGEIYLKGSASPQRWLYDVDLKVNNLDWNMPDSYIHLPYALTGNFVSTVDSTSLRLDSDLTSLDFSSRTGLERLVASFTKTSEVVSKEIAKRDIDISELQTTLPQFNLDVEASGKGLLSQFLTPSGISIDTISASFSNDSILKGNASLFSLSTAAFKADSLNFNLKQRGKLLDYALHMGNRPGTFDEFAQATLRGYIGANRLGAYFTQHNIKNEMGYRLGLTAAMQDSTLSVHFTPLKATIAYMPWTFNDDNYIDYQFKRNLILANLEGKSNESSILLRTEPIENDGQELHVALDNIKIEDFLKMSIFAPPVKGSIDSDIRVRYDGHALNGKGTVDVRNLVYDNTSIGDLDFDLNAGVGLTGDTDATIALKVNGNPAMKLTALLKDSGNGLEAEKVSLALTKLPLSIGNAFLPPDMMNLGGSLSGEMEMTGAFTKPVLNGEITCDSAYIYLPIMDSNLKFDSKPIVVNNSVLTFNDFSILAMNKNPLVIDGSLDMRDFSKMSVDMAVNASNFQLVGTNRKSKSPITGKLFLDLAAKANGPLSYLDINGNLAILGTSDVTYTLGDAAAAALQQQQSADEVVKFVNFNDSTQMLAADSITSSMSMRVNASLNIQPGTEVTVNLSDDGQKRVQVHPSGTLNYYQNFMGDMKLNGQLNTGEGQVKYSLPVMGERIFDISPQSYILWRGDLMDPVLNLSATDNMKANVTQTGGNSHLVNFLVTVKVSNSLAQPSLAFDLAAQDDISVQNEIESMSADQRATQAMNLLLYGHYSGQNMRGNTNLSGNMLYGLLTSQLNSLSSRYIKGVDLSFGIDQYDRTLDGNTSTTTSYSYQLSKSLFNNRFKIIVGGNYSTDASADENLAQNLISDISFEYILKQTNTLNMSAKLFRHTGYESILEGEVTETGVGFVMRRKLSNLRNLFRFRHRRKPAVTIDSITQNSDSSLNNAKNEK